MIFDGLNLYGVQRCSAENHVEAQIISINGWSFITNSHQFHPISIYTII